MSHALLPDEFMDDPRLAKCDLAHLGLIACGRVYCARHLTDGRLPGAVLRKFGTSGKGPKLARELVALGIYAEDGEDFIDTLYLEHNLTRAEAEERRAKISEARQRAGQEGGRRSGESRRSKAEANAKQVASTQTKQNEALSDPIQSDPIQDPPQSPPTGGGPGSKESEKKPETETTNAKAAAAPEPSSRASNVDRLGAFGMEGTWWAEGVAKATGGTPIEPNRFELRDLSHALATAFKGLGQVELERAVRESAEEYAGSLRANQRASVNGYRDWLREQPRRQSVTPKPYAKAQAPLEKPPLTLEENGAHCTRILEELFHQKPKKAEPAEEAKAAGGEP